MKKFKTPPTTSQGGRKVYFLNTLGGLRDLCLIEIIEHFFLYLLIDLFPKVVTFYPWGFPPILGVLLSYIYLSPLSPVAFVSAQGWGGEGGGRGARRFSVFSVVLHDFIFHPPHGVCFTIFTKSLGYQCICYLFFSPNWSSHNQCGSYAGKWLLDLGY